MNADAWMMSGPGISGSAAEEAGNAGNVMEETVSMEEYDIDLWRYADEFIRRMPVCVDSGGMVRTTFLILTGWLPGTGEERIICGQYDGKNLNCGWKEPASCCDFGIECVECERL
jgi:hypothetical protein